MDRQVLVLENVAWKRVKLWRWLLRIVNGDGGEGGVRSWSDSSGQGKQNAVQCKIQGTAQNTKCSEDWIQCETQNTNYSAMYKSEPECKLWYRSWSAPKPFPFNWPLGQCWYECALAEEQCSALDVWRGKDHNLRSSANTFTLWPTWWIPKMELTISHLSKQEGRSLEWNSKVANLPPTLMWRYIGRAVTDGEFGVLQSKLNLFQMAPLGPHKPPWGDLWGCHCRI